MGNKQTPINRNNKFFSEEDYQLEISMGREAIEGDGNFVVVLYRVDRSTTMSDSIYGEAGSDEIRFYPPVELEVSPILEEADNKVYNTDNGTLRYLETGVLNFDIYQQQLEELSVDITFGDYIGWPVSETEMAYFTVHNDGVKNFDNSHMIMGYKPAFRTIECNPTDENEFRGV